VPFGFGLLFHGFRPPRCVDPKLESAGWRIIPEKQFAARKPLATYSPKAPQSKENGP
jgi:hypothetical protein